MTSRQLLLIVAIIVALGAIWAFGAKFLSKPPEASPTPTVEVTLTPTPTPTMFPATTTITAMIGEKMGNSNIYISPLAVLEDSRCPESVQCIQAGTVRLSADIMEAGTTTRQVLTLGKSLKLASTTVTMIAVNPLKKTTTTIPTATYSFTFEAVKR